MINERNYFITIFNLFIYNIIFIILLLCKHSSKIIQYYQCIINSLISVGDVSSQIGLPYGMIYDKKYIYIYLIIGMKL